MQTKAHEEAKRLKNAVMHYGDSAEDYISGRCLVLNNLLLTGLALQVSAIEKMLKAIIGTKDLSCNLKSFSHNLTKLFNQVDQYTDYDIKRFGYYIPKLEQIYKMRYHDNRIGEFMYGGITDEGIIDDFYIELVDQIQITPELKYNAGLLPIIFDPYDDIRQHKRWATLYNSHLVKKLPKWMPMAEKYFLSMYSDRSLKADKVFNKSHFVLDGWDRKKPRYGASSRGHISLKRILLDHDCQGDELVVFSFVVKCTEERNVLLGNRIVSS